MAITKIATGELLDARDLDLGRSDWFRIEQPRVDGFADFTEDHQWIHVDPERAFAGPFGGTIAHGYLTLSLVPHLLSQLLEITDEVQGVNYGLDALRFTNPVPVGSEIRLSAKIKETEGRPGNGVRCRVGLAVEIRGHERPALVGDLLLISYGAES